MIISPKITYLPSFSSSSSQETEDLLISRGGFGVVYKYYHPIDEQVYAIKKIRLHQRDWKQSFQEVKLLSQLFHPHIIRYHHSWIELGTARKPNDNLSSSSSSLENISSISSSPFSSSSSSSSSSMEYEGQSIYLCYQMEFCPMSLESYLHEQRSLWFSSTDNHEDHRMRTRTLDLYYQVQIMNGFRYLHEHGIIHGDIKPSNLLIQQNHCIKIADFGFSVVVRGRNDTCVDGEHNGDNDMDRNTTINHHPPPFLGGTTMYASPEMLCTTNTEEPLLTFASDVFSVGLVCIEMNELFCTQMEKIKTFHNIRRGDISSYHDFFMSKVLFSSMVCEEHPQRISFTRSYPLFQSIYQSYKESESVISSMISQIVSVSLKKNVSFH